MDRAVALMVAAFVLLPRGTTLVAHHAFASEYDGQKTFTISGLVTTVEWTNPHVCIYVDVKGSDGTVANWNLELASPSALLRNGWSSRTLKAGETVTVAGYPAKAVATRGAARSVLVADGRSLFAGSSDDAAPPPP
jgi:hypothetical protein